MNHFIIGLSFGLISIFGSISTGAAQGPTTCGNGRCDMPMDQIGGCFHECRPPTIRDCLDIVSSLSWRNNGAQVAAIVQCNELVAFAESGTDKQEACNAKLHVLTELGRKQLSDPSDMADFGAFLSFIEVSISNGLYCAAPFCGDASCNPSESCDSCPQDCGPCTTCGDGLCRPESGEFCETCGQDCGVCPGSCNGSCEPGDCSTCPSDCGPFCFPQQCGQPCGSDVGECESGTIVCNEMGMPTGCNDIGPSVESCSDGGLDYDCDGRDGSDEAPEDGLDNDCDGVVDEDEMPRTIYLNRARGTYQPGLSDPVTNTSSIIQTQVELPPYNIDEAVWAEIVACVREDYAPFGVVITDTEPDPSLPYIEAVVGGFPTELGQGPGVFGLAESRCGQPTPTIVFVFAQAINDPSGVCHTISHETGHAYTLDHEILFDEIMSYRVESPSFMNVDAPCGDSESPRECNCGGPVQNSYQTLLSLLGPSGPLPDPTGGPPMTTQMSSSETTGVCVHSPIPSNP